MIIYKVCRFICHIVICLFWPLKIEGEDISNYKGPYILAANHVSYLDPFILGIAVKKPIYFIAKKEVFDIPILGFILKRIGVIPVDRKNINPASIRKSIALLKKDQILGIFPEGTRSLDGRLLEFNSGLIKIALQTNVPIIPVGLSGTFEIYPPHAKFPALFKKQYIYIHFGKPLYLDRNKRKEVKYIKDSLLKIENKIRELTHLSKKMM
ncbi:MAG: lysophospholipid acyltransferase family protein [Atribacterota bacterium]|jgi:1-acyl-sn-glycerol-3-phosphate acyltransferase|nr:lysophospholipid acyltransferase family protein [Atribacterota bacterium]MDD5636286.1 lysophospholipid acyltransferase family protein [Atribacterota bacterium]